MRERSILALIALGSLVMDGRSSPSDSRAGTAVRMDVEQMVQVADLVLEARVLGARSLETAQGQIETELELDVDRTLYGPDVPHRFVRWPGGVLADGRGMLLPGLALPRPGEDLLLLLSPPSSTGLRLPVGLSQGHFRLLMDRAGRRVAVRSQGRLTLVSQGSGALEEASDHFVIDYAELRARIESALALRRGFGAIEESK